jgi:hypothetical protein
MTNTLHKLERQHLIIAKNTLAYFVSEVEKGFITLAAIPISVSKFSDKIFFETILRFLEHSFKCSVTLS